MIVWYHDMYMDEYVSENPDKYKLLVEDDRVCIPSIYCIAIASNADNMFDIISCNELLFKHYKRNKLYVIGLATSHSGAVDLVMNIVSDIYESTGGFDVRRYFNIIV